MRYYGDIDGERNISGMMFNVSIMDKFFRQVFWRTSVSRLYCVIPDLTAGMVDTTCGKEIHQMDKQSALVVVDVQIDFCPGGSLAVPGGDAIIPVINRYIEIFRTKGIPVFATRDWHPPVTRHFREFGGLWPPHCVQGSVGARFHPALKLPDDVIVVSKGMDPGRDDYSSFRATLETGSSLQEYLRNAGVTKLYICGLATDYCVRETSLDALGAGLCGDRTEGCRQGCGP